jgi:tRNA pseudouridine55 synthase
MSRRAQHRSDPVDGFLLLNKPAGLTSNQALQKVKRLLNARKAGHSGSLDPAATGMLPLCFGEATKVCAFLLDADKTYRVTARLGIATDTGDADGKETAHAAVPALSQAGWQQLLQSFLGESMQVPPMYSALKMDGRRLYELARRGETVDRAPRKIRIDEIELLEATGTRLAFRVRCSKGTYIRALVEDIAGKAGTVAHTASLHREAIAGFRAEDMCDLSGLEAVAEQGAGALRARLSPPDAALPGLPRVRLGQDDGRRFASGQTVTAAAQAPAGLVRVYQGEEFLGVGDVSAAGALTPRRIFHAPEIKT